MAEALSRPEPEAADCWWPDAPGTVAEVRFAHSPGRFDPSYLNSLRAFDAAFGLDLEDGTRGIVGIDTGYHEWAKPEIPRPDNLRRYPEVAERSGAFTSGDRRRQGPVGPGRGVAGAPAAVDAPAPHRPLDLGRYVVVHPADNTDLAESCARYRALFAEPTTSRR